ncbi:hypothetical protein N9Y42_04605 [Mariniblastus sp.]|nr:hypothetical protein [Mariniblastus sp.]
MASYRAQSVCFLCLVVSACIFASGCGMFSSTDTTIKQVVDATNSRRSEMVTPTGKFSDYQVYRQPNSDVVVFEHKMKPGLQLDKAVANSVQFKTDLLAQLDTADSRSVLDSGITFEFLYVDASGNDICRHSVTRNDF